jgi:hypothetical protein
MTRDKMKLPKVTFLAFIILGIVTVILMLLYGGSMIKPHYKAIHADHIMTITLKTADQEEVIELLKAFAKEHDLKSGFGFKGPAGKMFLYEMMSNDLRIIAANPFERNIYEVSSYTDNENVSLKPNTEDLMGELKAEFEKFPGAGVLVKK